MGRPIRAAGGGWVYHVLNRANFRRTIFESAGDYEAFERILAEGVERFQPRLVSYCLMPNHWHLVVWPEADGILSKFVAWVTLTHTQRYHAHRHTAGYGHLYQGRFKSFPVQEDAHFYTLCRYVERNAFRAGLVERPDAWRFSSLWRMTHGDADSQAMLSPWPVARPKDWLKIVRSVQTEGELAAIRRSVNRGVPWGGPRWTKRVIKELGLETTLRPRGRPKKQAE
jgi:putative transposase